MGKKTKIINLAENVANKILSQGDFNTIKFYTRNSIPTVLITENIVHKEVFNKSDTFSIACSSCAPDNRNYVYVCAHRKDKDYIDMDPVCFAFNIDTGTPSPSGVISFHGSFEGRTSPQIDINDFIDNILSGAQAVTIDLDDAINCFSSAMHFMAMKFRNEFDE